MNEPKASKRITKILAAAATIVVAGRGSAANYTFNPTTSGLWNDGANWTNFSTSPPPTEIPPPTAANADGAYIPQGTAVIGAGSNSADTLGVFGGAISFSNGAVLYISYEADLGGQHGPTGTSPSGFAGDGLISQTNSSSAFYGSFGGLRLGTYGYSGTYLLGSNAVLTVGAGGLHLGDAQSVQGPGYFVQSGGTVSASSLTLGSGGGSYTQTAGISIIDGDVQVGSYSSTNRSSYLMSGGVLTVTGSHYFRILGGSFSQSGTAVVSVSGSPVDVRYGSSYAISGGSFAGAASFQVGGDGLASAFSQSGGTVTTDVFGIGSGSVTISAGTLSIGMGSNGGGEIFAQHAFTEPGGDITFLQTGGAHTAASILIDAEGGATHVTLTGGTNVAGTESISSSSTTYNQSGGFHHVSVAAGNTNYATILGAGSDFGGLTINNATYNLSGGTLLADVIIRNTTGVINWSGGALSSASLANGSTMNLSGTGRFIDGGWTNTGTINLQDADLTLASTGSLTNSGNLFLHGDVGLTTSGTSTVTVTNSGINALIAKLSGSGTSTLGSGITLNLPDTSTLEADTGTLRVNGSMTFTNTAILNKTGVGDFVFSGPSITGYGQLNVYAGAVTLIPSGSVTNELVLAVTSGASVTIATGNFNSGTLTGQIANFGTVVKGGTGTLSTFSLANDGSFTQSGGTILAGLNAPFHGGVSGTGSLSIATGSGQTASLTTSFIDQSLVTIGSGGSVTVINRNYDGTNTAFVNDGSLVVYASDGNDVSFGPVTNTSASNGTFVLGSATSAASFYVERFKQSSVTINDGSSLKVWSATRATNVANSLVLVGSSKLDLVNSDLATKNSVSSIRQFLLSGYNAGAWTGTGITSATVLADTTHKGIAYVNGANTNNAGLNPALSDPTVVYVRPSLIGDYNLDGLVTTADITQYNARGAFNDGLTTHDWADGDLNYDGKVDRFDIRMFNASTNFNSGTSFARPVTLSGATRAANLSSPTVVGTAGDGKPDLVYDPATGDVVFKMDGYTPPSGQVVVEIDVRALGAALRAGNGNAAAAGYVTRAASDVDYQNLGPRAIADGADLGTIFAIGLSPAALTASGLTASLYLNGDVTSTTFADVTSVPEPGTATLLLAATVAATSARRRRPRRAGEVNTHH